MDNESSPDCYAFGMHMHTQTRLQFGMWCRFQCKCICTVRFGRFSFIWCMYQWTTPFSTIDRIQNSPWHSTTEYAIKRWIKFKCFFSRSFSQHQHQFNSKHRQIIKWIWANITHAPATQHKLCEKIKCNSLNWICVWLRWMKTQRTYSKQTNEKQKWITHNNVFNSVYGVCYVFSIYLDVCGIADSGFYIQAIRMLNFDWKSERSEKLTTVFAYRNVWYVCAY